MADSVIPTIATAPSQSGAERGKCPAVRWRDVGEEGLMTFMAPLLVDSRPLLMTGHWTHQVLRKEAIPKWKTFGGIKSVFHEHGLDQLRESRPFLLFY